jgi:oxygen-dependent protoporphyrinogen oxidase
MSDVETVVIGAGAAGLGAATALVARGRDTLVLEARSRPGGVMQSERIDGFLVERGPNTTRIPADTLAGIQRAGIEAALLRASPESQSRFLLRPEGLVPVPMGPLAFARTPLLSRAGKWRMLREPFVPAGDGASESVAAFVARRLGPEAVDALVGPFLVGVYAGDEHALGAEAVFPSLVSAEREGGSILRGMLRRAFQGGPRGLPGSYSAPGGLGGLASLLARGLGERLRLGVAVQALVPEGGGWRIECSEGPVRARRLILAADSAGAAALLGPLDAEASAWAREIPMAPIVSVALGLAPEACGRPPEGFGFLVPSDLGLRLLGVLFMSRLFPGRAPPGNELATAMIGGLRWTAAIDAPDDELLEHVNRGIDRALVRGIRERLARQPPLALAGACWDGVALGEAFASGQRAAADLTG